MRITQWTDESIEANEGRVLRVHLDFFTAQSNTYGRGENCRVLNPAIGQYSIELERIDGEWNWDFVEPDTYDDAENTSLAVAQYIIGHTMTPDWVLYEYREDTPDGHICFRVVWGVRREAIPDALKLDWADPLVEAHAECL